MIKKIVSLMLSLLLCFGLLACSQVKSDEKDPLQNLESNLEENNLPNAEELEDEMKLKRGFYNLEEIYSKGLLTHDDLLSIAYYNNYKEMLDQDRNPIDYIPISINPSSLSAETEQKIINDFFKTYIEPYNTQQIANERHHTIAISEIEIAGYFGSYNEFFAIRVRDGFGHYAVVGYQIIDDLTLLLPYDAVKVILWHDDN